MRVLPRRFLVIEIDGETVQLQPGEVSQDLPDDVALALVRGMGADRVTDELFDPSEPTMASLPSMANAPEAPAAASKHKPRRRL